MADRTTNIVQQLLNRVEDLSQSILSASNESENNGLNEEVNRVFGRSNRTGSSQQSQENNVNASRPTVSTSTATHYQRAVAPRYQMPRNLTRRQASINRLWRDVYGILNVYGCLEFLTRKIQCICLLYIWSIFQELIVP